MNGYTREEMIGQPIDLLNIIAEKPEDRIAYYNELKQKGIIHMETSHRHKDGHIFPIEVSTSIIVIGGREMVLGIDRDITERKLAETALKESEDRYRSFISQVSEGVYRFECDQPMDINLPLEDQVDFIYDHMFIAECNDAFMKIYGIKDRKDLLGKGHLDFHGGRYHPVNRGALVTFVQNGYRIENAMTEETNQQGQTTYISNNSLGIIENNRLVRMWGTQIDITEKIRADKVQQVLYAISNAALSSSDLPDLIEFISDELGKLLDSTNFFIAFYNEETNMLSTIYEKDEKDILRTWSAEKSATGYVVRNQKSLLLREPEIRELMESGEIEIYGTLSKVWVGVPLFAENKAIGAIVVQNYDNPDAYTEKDKLMLEFISHQVSICVERKKVEQELNTAVIKAKESDRLKSAFLANMSHEIRTPLNSIIGFSELMADPDFDSGQQTEFAKIIINSGNSLLTIISDIMDFSKIEAGQVIVSKLQFVVQKLIYKLQKEYSLAAQDKGIELRIDPQNPKEDIWIKSDENRLRQVLVNLVGNAIKFTKKGYVEIGIKATGDCIQFHVSDTGIGIPEEYHDEIFERFRQVESSNSRKYGGNGLGLAISKSLVEIMGGEIWIESVQEKGSTFYFTIPIGLTTT
jgi:signal transduction histidine kinase